MIRKKKGQLTTQVLIYIIGAALFLGILVFGVQAVFKLMENQDMIDLIKFKDKLQNKIGTMQLSSGSQITPDFKVPSAYREICVFDSTGDELRINSKYPQFDRAWMTGTENIFLIPKQPIPLYIKDVKIENGYFCTEISPSFELKVRGEGRGVASIRPLI
ncbi:hypothetical protein ACFLZN_01225 [Nanoarchaeota archaeon]